MLLMSNALNNMLMIKMLLTRSSAMTFEIHDFQSDDSVWSLTASSGT